MIYDKIENYKIYSLGKAWDKSFSFLQSLTIEAEEKRYDLGDGIFSLVMSYATKTSADAVLESHRKYIDIQMSLSGAEEIECFNRKDLKVKSPYNDQRDVAFYEYPGKPIAKSQNIVGYFTALWPDDIHMPQLEFNNIKQVKKVVVKIPVELIGK